jgi:hypothetical protein
MKGLSDDAKIAEINSILNGNNVRVLVAMFNAFCKKTFRNQGYIADKDKLFTAEAKADAANPIGVNWDYLEFKRDLIDTVNSAPKDKKTIFPYGSTTPPPGAALLKILYGDKGSVPSVLRDAIEITASPSSTAKSKYKEDFVKGVFYPPIGPNEYSIDDIIASGDTGITSVTYNPVSPLLGLADKIGLPRLTAPSGTTSLNEEYAMFLGIGDDEAAHYGLLLALIGWMVPIRDHSTLEIVETFDSYHDFYGSHHIAGGIQKKCNDANKWSEFYEVIVPETADIPSVPAFTLALEGGLSVTVPAIVKQTVTRATFFGDETLPKSYITVERINALRAYLRGTGLSPTTPLVTLTMDDKLLRQPTMISMIDFFNSDVLAAVYSDTQSDRIAAAAGIGATHRNHCRQLLIQWLTDPLSSMRLDATSALGVGPIFFQSSLLFVLKNYAMFDEYMLKELQVATIEAAADKVFGITGISDTASGTYSDQTAEAVATRFDSYSIMTQNKITAAVMVAVVKFYIGSIGPQVINFAGKEHVTGNPRSLDAIGLTDAAPASKVRMMDLLS